MRADAKGTAWKVAVAGAMKSHTNASNPWLARRLNMGSPFRLSQLASVCASDPTAFEPYASQIAECWQAEIPPSPGYLDNLRAAQRVLPWTRGAV